jgi:hypothetical protein
MIFQQYLNGKFSLPERHHALKVTVRPIRYSAFQRHIHAVPPDFQNRGGSVLSHFALVEQREASYLAVLDMCIQQRCLGIFCRSVFPSSSATRRRWN